MKKYLEMAKSNPIIVIAIALAIVSLVVLGVIHGFSRGLVQKIQDRSKVVSTIDGHLKTSVRIPSEKPDEPPQQLTICVNNAAVQALDKLNRSISKEYDGIVQTVQRVNHSGHEILMPGLLPAPARAQRTTVKQRYRDALQAMLKSSYNPSPSEPVSLLAGLPPDMASVNATIQAAEKEFMAGQLSAGGAKDLSPKDRQRLRELQLRKVMELFQERAQSLQLYAQTEVGAGDFPLDYKAIRGPQDPAEASDGELWEGQIGFWIQQDIIKAIATANGLSDVSANVINAPVKRLIQIWVVPGSVGADSEGGLKVRAPALSASGNSSSGFGAPIMSATGQQGQAFQPPAVADPSSKLPDDFHRSPTGRVANGLYDVRHVWVSVVVDSQQLPKLIQALSQVNFMSVLQMDLRDVDEYDALREGYFYGVRDAVRADMLIETVWFRDWLLNLMPTAVLERYGLRPLYDQQLDQQKKASEAAAANKSE